MFLKQFTRPLFNDILKAGLLVKLHPELFPIFILCLATKVAPPVTALSFKLTNNAFTEPVVCLNVACVPATVDSIPIFFKQVPANSN